LYSIAFTNADQNAPYIIVTLWQNRSRGTLQKSKSHLCSLAEQLVQRF